MKITSLFLQTIISVSVSCLEGRNLREFAFNYENLYRQIVRN
jgi:hypothetical protein